MIIIAILISMFVVFTLALVSSVLYFRLGFLSRFFHDILRWHTPDPKVELEFIGYTMHATCRHCKKHIMQDSQGNWFTDDEC